VQIHNNYNLETLAKASRGLSKKCEDVIYMA